MPARQLRVRMEGAGVRGHVQRSWSGQDPRLAKAKQSSAWAYSSSVGWRSSQWKVVCRGRPCRG
eukprot:5420537-Pyramimonas_sp.AAC.1